MKVKWTENAASDFAHWQKHDSKKLTRIRNLIKDIQKTPFSGIGKPEPLKHNLSGTWSRRINQEHRLIYKIQKNIIIILSCRFHYKK